MEENKNLAKLYCTGCNYCKPCPQGIDIPYLFEIMNRHRVYGLTEHAKSAYKEMIDGLSWVKSADASKCVSCGTCEEKCPQKLPIIKQLKETQLLNLKRHVMSRRHVNVKNTFVLTRTDNLKRTHLRYF